MSFEASIDPSNGVNYVGGSSYSQYLPITPSNAGLVGLHGNVRNVNAGALSYEEAMNWSPTPMTNPFPNPLAGLGESQSINPLFYWLAAGALAWFMLRPKERWSY